MIDMDAIERISWWSTTSTAVTREMTKVSRLMANESAILLPPGRAIANNFDADAANCSAMP